ncbi:MAG: hypothetical protein IJF78_05160 [Clostridia bacterium]|nr:hypothetical protein [Clostridia bacterium]
MRKMLLGIYLALLGIAVLIGFGVGTVSGLAALAFFFTSAHFTLDGYFTWGPKAREDGEDSEPPLPPQYK